MQALTILIRVSVTFPREWPLEESTSGRRTRIHHQVTTIQSRLKVRWDPSRQHTVRAHKGEPKRSFQMFLKRACTSHTGNSVTYRRRWTSVANISSSRTRIHLQASTIRRIILQNKRSLNTVFPRMWSPIRTRNQRMIQDQASTTVTWSHSAKTSSKIWQSEASTSSRQTATHLPDSTTQIKLIVKSSQDHSHLVQANQLGRRQCKMTYQMQDSIIHTKNSVTFHKIWPSAVLTCLRRPTRRDQDIMKLTCPKIQLRRDHLLPSTTILTYLSEDKSNLPLKCMMVTLKPSLQV